MTELKTIQTKYTFTAAERETLATQVSNKIQDKEAIVADQKATAADFSRRVKRIDAEIADAARGHREGFEMRPVVCRMERDYERKLRVWRSTETAEIVREEPFSQDDYQLDLSTQIESKTTAYNAGLDAGFAYDEITMDKPLNPYEADTDEAASWDEGFEAGQAEKNRTDAPETPADDTPETPDETPKPKPRRKRKGEQPEQDPDGDE